MAWRKKIAIERFASISARARVSLAALMVVATAATVTAGLSYDASRSHIDIAAPPDITPSAQAVKPPSVATFLGDAYTRGIGAPAGGSYAQVLSAAFCWQPNYMGHGETGYASPGRSENGEVIFEGRVADVVASKPNLVIVQGSANDPGGPDTVLAAKSVFDRLRAELPNTAIIAVGPTNPPGLDPVRVGAAREAVQEAAASSAITFIDATGFLDPQLDYAPDGIHPHQGGHRKLGQLLYREIRDLQLEGITTCADKTLRSGTG